MFELDKESKQILKYIQSNPSTEIEELIDMFGDSAKICIDLLIDKGFVYQSEYSLCHGERHYLDIYSITAKGKAYFEHKLPKTVYELFPYAISTVSLILSIISLILSCSQ